MRVNYIQRLESDRGGKGAWAISCHVDKGSASGAVTPGAELKVETEKPGRENQPRKGPTGTVQADAALTGVEVCWPHNPDSGAQEDRLCVFLPSA